MISNRYCVIMAGGIGSRFWPKSRQNKPKQFLDILGTGKSFLRHTFERLEPLVGASKILIITNQGYKDMVMEHIPEIGEDQIFCEPIGRNTAPCIAYAAYYLAKKDPSAQMIIAPSDHYISDENIFRSTLLKCLDFSAQRDVLMTIGIKPSRPECGYGYIQVSSADEVNKVKCFVEKPNLEMAQLFVESGEFVWNSGIFIWDVKSIISAFAQHLPEYHSLFSSINDHYATPKQEEAIDSIFSLCKSISIDYGVMEKADNVYVVVGEFGWSDIGTWGSLFEHVELDDNGNIAPQNSYLYSTSNSVISVSESKVAVISGLKEYIVVDSEDVLMICPRSEEQNIKNFIDDIKYRGGDKHL